MIRLGLFKPYKQHGWGLRIIDHYVAGRQVRKAVKGGEVNSPTRTKPKKAKQTAAQNIFTLGMFLFLLHKAYNFISIEGDIGCWDLVQGLTVKLFPF